MKKMIVLILFLLFVVILFTGLKIFGPTVKQPQEKFLYIKTGANYQSVAAELVNKKIVKSTDWFRLVSRLLKYKIIKPGKYEIKKGMSIFNLVRTLKNDQQSRIDLVIIKFRTKEEFARRIGKEFETDSLQMMGFLNNNDSLRHYGLDTNT